MIPKPREQYKSLKKKDTDAYKTLQKSIQIQTPTKHYKTLEKVTDAQRTVTNVQKKLQKPKEQ